MSLAIVGFGGRPVLGAAGIKAPLVRDSESGRFSVFHQGSPGNWWGDSEIEEFEDQALLTLLDRRVAYSDRVVAIYAHRSFIAPSIDIDYFRDIVLPVQLSVSELIFEREIQSYVGLVTEESAHSLLDTWGNCLLSSARAALYTEEVARVARAKVAARELMRARYVTVGRVGSNATELRRETTVLGWATQLMIGEDDEHFRADAALDFSHDELAELGRKASHLFVKLPTSTTSRSHSARRDSQQPPYRHQEDLP